MKINIYANYGCLAAEKRTIYTWGNPACGVGYDKMTVELPDGWDYDYTVCGDLILTSPDGKDYPINDILCGDDEPMLDTGKQRYVLK